MIAIFKVLMVLAMLATVGVLGAGLIGLAKGNDPRRSNQLMQWRIGLQAVALVFVVILISLRRHS